MSLESLLTDEKEQASIRERAKRIIESLEVEASSESRVFLNADDHQYGDHEKKKDHSYKSWIRGTDQHPDSDYTPSPRCKFFDQHGFLFIKAFATHQEILDMKQQMQSLVDQQWHPDSDSSSSSSSTDKQQRKHKLTAFRTDEKQIENQGSDDYFLQSANKVHFFAEPHAMTTSQTLKEIYKHDKIKALNKAGHGMHLQPGPFHTYSTSEKISSLTKELGWEDPVIPQSMYIFKPPGIGGQVTSHQDSTFLYTTPKQSCLGLWLALDDATITNGCLWVRPGSHGEPTRVKFARNPKHFGASIEERSHVPRGDPSESQMVFIDEEKEKIGPKGNDVDIDIDVDWVGKIPQLTGCETAWDSLFAAGFVPVECKAGDLVVFPGELDHLSLANVSECQRHTFQLHLVEGDRAGVTWADTNWLQYPKGAPFLSIK